MILRIKTLRIAANMTQTRLAEEMGVGQNTISNWENETFLPKTRELPRLAEILGCTVSDLYNPEADAC